MYVRITNHVSGRTAQAIELKEVLVVHVQLRMSGSCRANIFRGVVFGAGLGPAPPPEAAVATPEAAVATVLPAPQL